MVRFCRDRHQLLDTEIARFLRRILHRDDLFTYRHRRTGRWEIAVWANPNRDLFVELLGMNSLSEFDRPCVEALRLWNEGRLMSGRERARQIRSEERAEDQRFLDEQAESLDVKRCIGRKLGSDNPEWDRPGLPVHITQA
jgi:hypothetical protein